MKKRNQQGPATRYARRKRGNRRLLIETLEDRRLLTLYTINSYFDGVPAEDGRLTLREAIEASNSNQQVGDARPGSLHDEIRFPSEFDGGTIWLDPALGPLEVRQQSNANTTDKLHIAGPGPGLLTIDGQEGTGIFTVSGTFSMSNLTITGSNTSAIKNRTFVDTEGELTPSSADLVLNNVHFVGNDTSGDGGAILFETGSLRVNGGLFDDNTATGKGGAIFLGSSTRPDAAFRPDAAIYDATFSSNSATDRGGAIANENGKLNVFRTEFVSNESDSDGGAISSNTIHDSINRFLYIHAPVWIDVRNEHQWRTWRRTRCDRHAGQ